MIDIAKLRTLAEAATPGPRERAPGSATVWTKGAIHLHVAECETDERGLPPSEMPEAIANAECIAAFDRETMLSLLAEAEAGRALRKEAGEALAILHLCRTRTFDAPEDAEVGALGRRIGFGAVISAASKEWASEIARRGDCPGGQYTAGPCLATVDPTRRQLAQAIDAYDVARGKP